jgi:hypothetical protein
VADLLRRHGAGAPQLTVREQFRAACLAADEAEARRLLALEPRAIEDPGLLAAAAEHGNVPGLRLALALGAAVDATEHDGLTPLHRAGRGGHLAVVQELIARGAPFQVRDRVYAGTPIDHATFFCQRWPSAARSETRTFLLAHTTDPFDLVNHDRDRLAARAAVDPAAARVKADVEAIERAYRAFNARDIETAVAALHPEVDWPNAIQGTRLHGREQVRAYWTGQWQTMNPQVDPEHFRPDADGRIVVDVHQVVRSLTGELLVDQRVGHAFELEGGLGRRMDIVAV